MAIRTEPLDQGIVLQEPNLQQWSNVDWIWNNFQNGGINFFASSLLSIGVKGFIYGEVDTLVLNV